MKNIELTPVKSSQIHSIGHDAETQTLAIRFKDRATGGPAALYHYENVTASNFDALKSAESLGSHFGKYIKPHKERFPYALIEKTPAARKPE